MENIQVMFSSQSNEWSTPTDFFEELNTEFNFTLDPCATRYNAKCQKYFTQEDNGLEQSWEGEIVFCNPPYGKEIKDWVRKAYIEGCKPNTTVVLLVPARTDTKWFHEFVYHDAKEIRFIKGRLKFGDSKNAAPFPSMVVVYRGPRI